MGRKSSDSELVPFVPFAKAKVKGGFLSWLGQFGRHLSWGFEWSGGPGINRAPLFVAGGSG